MKGKKVIIVKPYTPLQLAKLYGVPRKTFSGWLKPFKEQLGKRIGHYYHIRQVEEIFRLLSVPYFIEDN